MTIRIIKLISKEEIIGNYTMMLSNLVDKINDIADKREGK